MRWLLAIACLGLFFGGLSIGCSTSSNDESSDADCVPPPGSCDGPAPIYYQVDLANQCVQPAQVTLSEICSTSVNRCGQSAGIGPACAFAADGGVYIQSQSDNNMYSANGWTFDQPYGGFANPNSLPANQHASDAQQNQCFAASCFRYCSGTGPKLGFSCATDGGHD